MRYRTRLYIDLKLLAENVALLREICPNNEIVFMVKADAYGHGMLQVVRYAVTELGIKEFGCATLGEAVLLREELSDLEFEVYVTSDTNLRFNSCADNYLNKRIVPVISNMEDFEFFISNDDFKHFPICLKFNTGMNRIGINEGDLSRVIDQLKASGRKTIHHLMTHFGQASERITEESPVAKQYECFTRIKETFKREGFELEKTSVSNSGAIEQNFGLEETHIRPGLILYGPSSLDVDVREFGQWRGKNISRLETYVINSFPVEQGMSVGYGGVPCPENGVMALIAFGYGDGFYRRMMGETSFYHSGLEGKIFGPVNMDMTQVFFPGKVLDRVKMDDNFRIWGHDTEDILRLADQIKAEPYELFCHITVRVPRIYN